MSCQIVDAGELGSTAWFVTSEVARLVYKGMPLQILGVWKCSSTAIMTTLMSLHSGWIVCLKMMSEEPLVYWYMG